MQFVDILTSPILSKLKLDSRSEEQTFKLVFVKQVPEVTLSWPSSDKWLGGFIIALRTEAGRVSTSKPIKAGGWLEQLGEVDFYFKTLIMIKVHFKSALCQ